MPTTRFKGETAGERLDYTSISDADMIQLRHKPGTIDDADKGISKASLQSCPFGVSDTAAATAAKAASLTDSNPDFTLISGREVVVCFTTANTASSPTLNFAGSGAIPLYYPDGSAVGAWPADTWMHLKYFYATVGNTQIQRWILLSPIGKTVDTVAANNMNSVTSNAVANTLRNYHCELINHTVDYYDNTIHYDCNDYLNKNIEIFANIEQFSNLPSFADGALMCWFISRGENLIHNSTATNYRNIQEALIVSWVPSSWVVRKYRRFAIDATIFEWQLVN